MENDDPWFAPDKLYHLLFCFSLTLILSAMANLTRLRRHSIAIASLLAGAAKEAADEFGFFSSAGASGRDAVADVLGASLGLSLVKLWSRPARGSDPIRGVSLV